MSSSRTTQRASDLDWQAEVRSNDADGFRINKFAFVIHPLDISYIHNHPRFGWTRWFPDALIEEIAARVPPVYLGRISGLHSPTSGQKVEGYLFSLGATPRQMLRKSERLTYARLKRTARMAERRGARILGLGAFTSVVGDAGITVAREAKIAVTSGNSLTALTALEATKTAAARMGISNLADCRAMVIGATGSIGSICARLLAREVQEICLVSLEPAKLVELQKSIQVSTPGANVTIATAADGGLSNYDLILTATSAFGQRILNITRCKPGAVICDVARPPDISQAEAALRPDVLLVESGEVTLPGNIQSSYDIGLEPGTAYACLAETALLAMEGRFEDFTIGREITTGQVEEISRLFNKHKFKLAALRSFGRVLSEEDFYRRRSLAEQFRQDPDGFAAFQQRASLQLAQMPAMAKGVSSRPAWYGKLAWIGLVAGAGLGILTAFGFYCGYKKKKG
jgi:predicted amino acid dehydrogenase